MLRASATIAPVSGSNRGIWQFLVGIVLMGVFGLAASLLRAGWRVSSGMLVATTIALVPG